ncbi:winged helix-turn-helix transcriptional regulator [Paenibacillus odorifer]|uniref:winged helix-turn-helix transcriptional regulator n=1 Tax=Paenibacillus odorifer TaxID=189426 RepID=UPI0021167EBE|nr:winged helix-turn-helix transcriptional regulator [Paenibacillus odorifer]
MPGVSRHVLTTQLRELEVGGIVKRTAFLTMPPKVEYTLTDFVKKLGTHSGANDKSGGALHFFA